MADSMNSLAASVFAVVAVSAAALHFAFLGYLIVGGFLSWRWPGTLWLHVPVVGWAVASLAFGLPCPLTDLERIARAAAGMGDISAQGFIDQYITGVWYPEDLAILMQALVFTAIAGSWIGFGIRSRTRPAASPAR